MVEKPPTGSEWIHETKFDGYRIQAVVKGSKVKLYTRAGNDWVDRFPLIEKALRAKKLKQAAFDGEVVWIDEKGRSDFQKLQNAIKSDNQSRLYYYIFDILSLDGHDLRSLPLMKRKEVLKDLLGQMTDTDLIRFSEHSAQPGNDLLEAACSLKLEGLVSKKSDSPYPAGRNGDWVKSKCVHNQEFVIGGFTTGTGTRVGFGSLLLGVFEKGNLRYVGKVGTGFTNESLIDLKKTLSKIQQDENPFEPSKEIPRKNVFWVQPVLSAEIVFADWTSDGQLRVPVFHGLREDKPTKEIHEETPMQTETIVQTKKSRTSKKLELTHPEKILYQKEKLTKLDVAQYYIQIADQILPTIEGRPLTLVRCPEGTKKVCFFQKHLTDSTPDTIHGIEVQEKNKTNMYMSVNDTKGLASLVQMGAFEIHCWNAKEPDIEKPDQIVMDFDPGPGVPWKKVIGAAYSLKEILDSLGLKSFVKLSGGKGVHVHVPFKPLYDWDQVKEFSKALALQLQKSDPKFYVTNMSKAERSGKIFIDYLRNARGSTAVAPYSLRARELSSVAMPLSWKELKNISGPQAFTLEKTLTYLKKRKNDPWEEYYHEPQQLPHLKVQDS